MLIGAILIKPIKVFIKASASTAIYVGNNEKPKELREKERYA